MALQRIADVLWRERHVVEYLLFKLVTAKMLLAAGEQRFLPAATDEVNRVLERLAEAERVRTAELERLAPSMGVDVADLSLAELARLAPSPMDVVFAELHEDFQSLADEIDATLSDNRRLASAGLEHVRASIVSLTGPQLPSTYTAAGRHDRAMTGPLKLDQVM